MIKMKHCDVCPNHCSLEGMTICGRSSKINENIVETTGIAIDPIEKKPLYHFMPGSKTLSIGGLGCNLKCLNCQNHEIAQPTNPKIVPINHITPNEIVNIALESHLPSISWTYNEPTIHPEWIITTAKLAQEYDINTILVTNGYTSQKTLEKLVNYVDAVNVDLKSFNDSFYVEVCKGRLSDVQNSIEYYYDNGIHTEVTTLLIPGYNDSDDEITSICDYILNISSNIVLHFSAFVPRFKLSHIPYTKESTVMNACEIGRKMGLKYVFPGNTYPSSNDNTYCKCGQILIERELINKVYITEENNCPSCGTILKEIKI